jgi:hypothetical protein
MPSPPHASNSSAPPNFSVKDSSKESELASPWYSMVTSLLGQNNQIQVIEKESSKKTDDDQGGFLSVLANWGALAGGLLKKQEEEKPVLPPQKNPPKPVDTSTAQKTQRREVPQVAPEATKPNPQSPKTKASECYSHSFYIWRLQEKFDNDNNISYKTIQDNKNYFDIRVAKWDEELKGLHVETSPPRQKNERRKMGFDGYVEYLDKNIEKLKLKEDDTSVNQEQLKTLIAFHYLEKAKVFYSSGQLYLGGDSSKKQSVFKKVPEKYRSYLSDEKFKISQNSYTLPNLEKEPTPEFPRFSSQLNKPPAMSDRARIAINSAIDGARELAQNEAAFINKMGGRRVVEVAKAVGRGAGKVGDAFSGALDRAGDGIVRTGVRATPGKMTLPNQIRNNDSGYATNFPSVREHDSRLRSKQIIEGKLGRDTQPDALARDRYKRGLERGEAMHRQANGGNFHEPYNNRHGGGSR